MCYTEGCEVIIQERGQCLLEYIGIDVFPNCTQYTGVCFVLFYEHVDMC